MFKAPFSFNGRIRRLEYGLSILIYIAVYFVLILAVQIEGIDNNSAYSVIVFLLCFIPIVWFILAQAAKRCHDLGNNGWWQLIPFYGLWLIFQDGQSGENGFGDNPKYPSSDLSYEQLD